MVSSRRKRFNYITPISILNHRWRCVQTFPFVLLVIKYNFVNWCSMFQLHILLSQFHFVHIHILAYQKSFCQMMKIEEGHVRSHLSFLGRGEKHSCNYSRETRWKITRICVLWNTWVTSIFQIINFEYSFTISFAD